MWRCFPGLIALLVLAAPLNGQALRDRVSSLFRFGDCGDPLCLNLPNAHGDHYIPDAVQGNNNLIAFLTNAIGVSVANIPLSAASGGATFTFEGGLPVKSTVSSGPIFGERAQTLGRGRFLAGANVTGLQYESLRGAPLDNLEFNFVHQDVGQPGLGDPEFENDVIQVRTSLDANLLVTTLFATYGILDRVDIGVAVPIVRTSLSGTSEAQVIPWNGAATPHRFGTSLVARVSTDGSATGIGDVAVRMKVNLSPPQGIGVAVLGDLRLPTGDEAELLGSGDLAARGLGIVSARYGDFSPHANGGFVYRSGEMNTSAILANAGFDQLITPQVTFAFDLLSEWQVGDNAVTVPGTISFVAPVDRSVMPTNIPERKDNLVNAAFGGKFTTAQDLTLVINALVPLNRGGIRPTLAWTVGLEYNF